MRILQKLQRKRKATLKQLENNFSPRITRGLFNNSIVIDFSFFIWDTEVKKMRGVNYAYI